MADQDPLSDVFNLFAAPVAGTIRSVEQFRTGVDEFLKGVENFNRTMANLNETTERINNLLAEVEEPLRVAVPQFTRTVKAADEVTQAVAGPAIAAAPAFKQIAEAVSTPAFQQFPTRVAQFNEMVADVSRRVAPLTQLAESAGGLGAILSGFRLPGTQAPPAAEVESDEGTEFDDDFDSDDVESDDLEPDDGFESDDVEPDGPEEASERDSDGTPDSV